jgi:hypothetical protein
MDCAQPVVWRLGTRHCRSSEGSRRGCSIARSMFLRSQCHVLSEAENIQIPLGAQCDVNLRPVIGVLKRFRLRPLVSGDRGAVTRFPLLHRIGGDMEGGGEIVRRCSANVGANRRPQGGPDNQRSPARQPNHPDCHDGHEHDRPSRQRAPGRAASPAAPRSHGTSAGSNTPSSDDPGPHARVENRHEDGVPAIGLRV